jgi:hypothetical protein
VSAVWQAGADVDLVLPPGIGQHWEVGHGRLALQMGTVDALRAGYATFILSLLGTALVVSAILSGSSSPDADSEALAAQVEHVRAAPRALTAEPATGACLVGVRLSGPSRQLDPRTARAL